MPPSPVPKGEGPGAPSFGRRCHRDRGRAVASLLFLHFVEVLEAAGIDEHDGEEEEVVGGVDDDAGGQGTRFEADGT